MRAISRLLLAAFALFATVAYGQLQPAHELRPRGIGAQSVASFTPLSLAAADFDVDGYPDLACGYAEGRVSVYFGDRYAFMHTGVADPFREDVLTIDVPVRAELIAAGDFDGDLRPDLAIA